MKKNACFLKPCTIQDATPCAQRGFSLTELVMVMALTAAVACFAIPSYRLMMAKSPLRLACLQLAQAVTSAREAALNNRCNVILCGSRSGASCDGAWRDGQWIGVEASRKGILFLPALPRQIDVAWRSNLGRNEFISFTPSGVTAGQWGSFWVQEARSHTTCRVVVNALGRVEVL